MDPDVVARDAGHKPAGGRHGPRLRVALQEVGVRLDESGRPLVTAVIRIHRRAGQRGDTHCQRRRRVSAGLLPAVLWRDRPFADQVGGRLHHHRVWVKLLQRAQSVETPGQQDGEGYLVQLYTLPVRIAVQPEVLVKPAVWALGGRQIDQRAQRRLHVAGRQ